MPLSLCRDLEQKWTGVGVTPVATPTANTSHLTGRTGCASAGFMQICTCINLWTKYTHTHTHRRLESSCRQTGPSWDYFIVFAYYSHSHPLIYVMPGHQHLAWKLKTVLTLLLSGMYHTHTHTTAVLKELRNQKLTLDTGTFSNKTREIRTRIRSKTRSFLLNWDPLTFLSLCKAIPANMDRWKEGDFQAE